MLYHTDVQVNLERMVCGHLHLSAIIAMFSNRRNIPSLPEFVESTIMVSNDRWLMDLGVVFSPAHLRDSGSLVPLLVVLL